MHIKVVNSEKSVFREVDIYVDVVKDRYSHVISTDTNTVSATRANHAISCGFLILEVKTPKQYTISVKKWGESKHPHFTNRVIDNRRVLSDWLIYAKGFFKLSTVGVRIDSYNYTIDIFVFEDSTVYIDGFVVYKGVTNAN